MVFQWNHIRISPLWYYCALCFQVYISQILVASALGAVVEAVGSVRVIPMLASGGSFLGFLTAWFLVIYPQGGASSTEQVQGLVCLAKEAGPNKERTSQGPALLRLTDRESFIKTEYHSVVWKKTEFSRIRIYKTHASCWRKEILSAPVGSLLMLKWPVWGSKSNPPKI